MVSSPTMNGPGFVWMLTKKPSGLSGDASNPFTGARSALSFLETTSIADASRPSAVVRMMTCRRMPGAIRARSKAIAQRKGDPIAALVMHRAFIDWNDPLRPEGVVAHDAVAKDKGDFRRGIRTLAVKE